MGDKRIEISGRFCVGNSELQIEGTQNTSLLSDNFPDAFSVIMQISCMVFQEQFLENRLVPGLLRNRY